ncbi:MAG: hypothetical protein ACRETO_05240 [Gammaproteobacteria bacterium]
MLANEKLGILGNDNPTSPSPASMSADETISAMNGLACRKRDLLLTRATRKLANGQPADIVLERFASQLTNSLLHPVLACLRNIPDEMNQKRLLEEVCELFNLATADRDEK